MRVLLAGEVSQAPNSASRGVRQGGRGVCRHQEGLRLLVRGVKGPMTGRKGAGLPQRRLARGLKGSTRAEEEVEAFILSRRRALD